MTCSSYFWPGVDTPSKWLHFQSEYSPIIIAAGIFSVAWGCWRMLFDNPGSSQNVLTLQNIGLILLGACLWIYGYQLHKAAEKERRSAERITIMDDAPLAV